jgi:hypothetical protein
VEFIMTRLSFHFHRMLCTVVALLCFAGMAAPTWAQFETRATRALANAPFALVAGDFNGDGKLDVAVTGDYLAVMLGNGDGTFQPPVKYAGVFYSIAVADFNNDGNLDLVVAPDNNSVMVFLGNGDGTFQPPKTSHTTNACSFIVVGDFNGDNKMDIAVIDPPYVSVLLGNGDGTFGPPSDNNSFVGPQQLAVGDFNNDHKLDVAVVGFFGGSQDIGVLLGNGDGTLQNSLTYPLNYTPWYVAAADFNHDGKLDVAIGEHVNGGVMVLLGNGDGSFQPEADYTTTGFGGQVSVADFNGDGNLDIVAMGGFPTGVNEFLGNGDGTFRPSQFCPAVVGGGPVVGDFNGDGKPDLALLGNPSGVTTMLNTGPFDFSPTTPVTFPAQTINTGSTPATATLSNTSTVAVSISSIKASGQFHLGSGTTCQTSVGPGASCAISVVFQPQSAGAHSGLVTLVDGASSKPQVIELSGQGTDLSVSPASLRFGSQKVGTNSKPRKINVTNEGSTTVNFSGIGIGGRNYQDFTETDNCFPQLAGGAACMITVIFDPTRTGPRSADVYLTVTAKDASPAPVMLTGTGD